MKALEKKIGKNLFIWLRSFVLVMAITCGLVIVLIQWIEKSFSNEIIDLNRRLAVNIQTGIDVRLNDIDNFMAVFMLTPDNLFLSKSTKVEESEREAMIRVSTKLNEYKLANRFIQDIGIYYSKLDYMVGNIGYFPTRQYYMLQNENNDYKFKDWKEDLAANEQKGYQLKKRFDGTNDLIYTKSIPFNNTRKDAILLLTVNRGEVEKILESEEYSQNTFENLMVGKDGSSYISPEEEILWIKDIIKNNKKKEQIETENYLGIVRASEYYEINYITLYNKKAVLQNVHLIKYLAFSFVVFFMGVGSFLFWIMGRKNNLPIKKLIDKLEIQNSEENRETDEYALIDGWIDFMQSNDRQYQKRILNQQETMEKLFLYNLLASEEKNNSIIFSSMQRFNLQFEFTTFQIMLIRSRKGFREEALKGITEIIIQKTKKYKDEMYVIVTEFKGDLVILFHMDSDYDTTRRVKLYNELKEDLGVIQDGTSIYLGGRYDTMAEIILSYHQARMMAEKNKEEKEGVLFYSDTQPCLHENDNQYGIMAEFTLEMLEDDYEGAKELLDKLFNQYVNKETNIFKARAKKYAIINAVIEALYKYKELDSLRKECIHSMEITKDNQSLLEAIHSILDLLQETRKTEQDNCREGCAAKAKEYIEEHFEDPMIGLYRISEELGISNTYLSSDFKKKYNVGVVQYINKLRIEKAKRMILNTDYSIKEIAFRVGFSSDMTFIRVFKQFENTTPGKYKRDGSMNIQIPQRQRSTFEPQVVQKRQKDISDIDQKIISMYAKGMTTRQISETLEDIYGFEASEGFISEVTDKILPQIEDWQNRPLSAVYPVLYIDAIHYSVRGNGIIHKLAAYVIFGINTDGKKEVLTIQVGDIESSKYLLSVLNDLKKRGVKDILIICADGLSGMKEAIAAAYSQTEYQHCIVHQVRNTLKYVAEKDRKPFATDLKTIYHALNEEKALEALEKVTAKWSEKYPNSMKRWHENWDVITPIFKFSMEVRKVIYTTNAIESLNATYRKLNRRRSVFPSDTALLKALYLATFEATKKWSMPIRNWGQVYGELSIMYEGRLPE